MMAAGWDEWNWRHCRVLGKVVLFSFVFERLMSQSGERRTFAYVYQSRFIGEVESVRGPKSIEHAWRLELSHCLWGEQGTCVWWVPWVLLRMYHHLIARALLRPEVGGRRLLDSPFHIDYFDYTLTFLFNRGVHFDDFHLALLPIKRLFSSCTCVAFPATQLHFPSCLLGILFFL